MLGDKSLQDWYASADVIQAKPKVLAEWKQKRSEDIQYQKFVQFNFFRQWKALKEYANKKVRKTQTRKKNI